MHEDALQNIRVTAQMDASHAAGLVQVRIRTFQQFPAFPQQPLTSLAVNPSPIRIDRVAFGVLRLVRQMRAPIFHLRDAGIGIVSMYAAKGYLHLSRP